jgi:hypothetical protein
MIQGIPLHPRQKRKDRSTEAAQSQFFDTNHVNGDEQPMKITLTGSAGKGLSAKTGIRTSAQEASIKFSETLTASMETQSATNTSTKQEPLPITMQDKIGELIGGFNHLLEIMGKREDELKEGEEILAQLNAQIQAKNKELEQVVYGMHDSPVSNVSFIPVNQ